MPSFNLPGILKPETASVFDPLIVQAIRKLAALSGGSDPASGLMGSVTPMMAAESKLAPLVRAYKGAYPYDSAGNAIDEFKSVGVPLKGAFENYVGKNGGFAGFFSDNPEVASRFSGPEGAVYPVDIAQFKNPLVIDAKGSFSANLQYQDMAKLPHEKSALLRMWETLRGPNSNNYDGIIIKNTRDEGTVFVPLKPDQVRSAFSK